MNEKPFGRKDELSERLLGFTVRIIKLVNALPKTLVGRHLATQLLSSGTSPGANYEEACGAESRADFIHKLGVVLKELKESRFWLRVVQQTELLPPPRVESLLKECEELCKIIAQSVITAKKK